MKTRTGFVSNSSSSSFIVSFHEDPANLDNLEEMMSGCGQEDRTYDAMTEDEVIQRVFSDVLGQHPATQEEILRELESDMSWEINKHINYDDYRDAERRIDWDAYDAKRDELREKLVKPKLKAFMAENKDKYVYILSYADDGGEAALEHGDIFSGISHIRISHH